MPSTAGKKNKEVEVEVEEDEVVDQEEPEQEVDQDDQDQDQEQEAEDAAPESTATAAKKAGKKGKSSRAKASKAKKQAKTKSSKKSAVKIVRKNEEDDDDEKKVPAADSKDEYRFTTGVLISQPTARDVKIGNFSLMAYGKDLIRDTTIELTIGRRYGLIGPNGSGKSTFLKCLAKREVPIPDFIDIFYLEEEAAPSDKTALETVITDANAEVARLETRLDELMEKYGADSDVALDISSRLEELDPSTFESRAGVLLHGLGFSKQMMNKQTKDLSGGWRMRVSLAKALFVKPTLLLLDEPTNHLDLEACVWLERYLAKYDRCLIVVSHSQDFLNGVCTNIIHITPKQTLQVYGGNYDQFVRTKAENESNQMKQYKKEQEDIKHIKDFIASCGTYANLVRQAKSKQKIIDKMVEKGLTEPVLKEIKFNFRFPEVEKLPPPIMAFHDVAFAYSGDMKDALYDDVNLAVTMDSRIALVGPNGAGKSTLLKLMCGEITPTKGSINRHLHMKIGRYHQHSNETLPADLTPLAFMRSKYAEQNKSEEEWRSALGRFGVRGAMQTTSIGQLSDGQKSRLVFAILAVERPNILLMDEPTNHLDMECIDSLADALNNFGGGLVLVSHDFRLIDQVAQEIWVCDNHTITTWEGNIRDYKKWLVKQMD